MIKSSNLNNLNSDINNNELIVAKQLFPTFLKVDEKTKEIYKNFNVEEYISEITRYKVNTDIIYEEHNENPTVNEDKNINELDNLEKNINKVGIDINSYKEELHFLRCNPLHLNRWYKFLELYEREEIYEQFLLIFPRCTLYWIKYAELKIKKKEYKNAYNIYRKCIDSNIYDLKLFLSFLYFAYHTSSIHEYISFLFESLRCVGTDIKSGNIWVELLYILIKIHNTNLLLNNNIQNLLYDPFKNNNNGNRTETPLLPSEKEQLIFKSPIPNSNSKISYIEHYTSDGKLRKFYQCWLNNATKYLDKVWKCFCSFEKSNDNFTNTYLSTYNTQYLNSKNAYKELSNLYREMNLDKKFKIIIPINKKSKIENNLLYIKWIKIINFEKSNPLKLKLSLVCKRIMYTYEQALIQLQFNADLWFSYFQFLLLNKKFNYAIRIMREAIEIYLPFDELLKLNFAYFLEKYSLINQAHYIYQLMLNEVTKKKKKFSLSFLYSKEKFKKLPYCHLKKKRKERIKGNEKNNENEKVNEKKKENEKNNENEKVNEKKKGNEKKNENEKVNEKKKGRKLEQNENDEENKKEFKKIKRENIKIEEKEKMEEKSNNDIENGDKNEMKFLNNPSENLSGISDDEIRRKFYQSDYENLEERKKYFIKYINVNKKKRRHFVFIHFLNFIKRNYDETVWRYYVGIIMNQEKCSEEIYYYCANIERRILNNEKRAMYIMSEGYKKFSSKKKYLFYYINFLLEKGNLNHIRTLVYKYVHDFYTKFYKEYEVNYSFDKKNTKSKIGQNEFNLFESSYLKLLKSKNKSCNKIWNLLIQLEIFYGDIRNLNKIFEIKLKYDSGYNLEENKNILLDFTNLSNNNENMLLDDNNITNILCKGYFENLKKNDIDSLQFKIKLINSQLFAGASLKKTFSFFEIKSINPFSSLTFCSSMGKKKKKREEKEASIILNEQVNEEDLNVSNINKSFVNENISKEDDHFDNDVVKNENDNNYRKQKVGKFKNRLISLTYDSFNFYDSENYMKKKKVSINGNINIKKRKKEKIDVTDSINYIIRPDLKTMSIYKPFESYKYSEKEKKQKKNNETSNPLNDIDYFDDLNKNNKYNEKDKDDKKEYILKREYFNMPNLINDFLSLLPQENSCLKLSDNSIDYLVTSLQNLKIPKLKKFPYEPIPIKEIIQIKNELNN
ncbi:conserved Plasmodium protein, unknown function [Plasmodium gallinaceum]|uniref:Suppressor of forked domain-containing protein n=1 Tax=Plasmodium gallinaceum TaxID=5849 RepID=A0A1J1GPT5_PLAGA|nr:conserved Plasmodium protein, unknown function [Plasmodium gallinaceum]CRG93034.1 conserved Plasmodium protein, unknown function [Plasmodium gallinaceum]